MEYIYKVKKGDTVLSVCILYGLNYEQFSKLNPDFDLLGHRYMDKLFIGEQLVVGRSNDIFDRLRIQERRRSKH